MTALTVTAPPVPTVMTLEFQYPPMPSVRWCCLRNASSRANGSGAAGAAAWCARPRQYQPNSATSDAARTRLPAARSPSRSPSARAARTAAKGSDRRELPGVQRRVVREGTRDVGREVRGDAGQQQLADQVGVRAEEPAGDHARARDRQGEAGQAGDRDRFGQPGQRRCRRVVPRAEVVDRVPR